MKVKRGKKFLALLMAFVLASSTNVIDRETNSKVKASVTDSENESTFKVTMNDTGYLTADSSTTENLENKKFSWDNATVYFVLTDRFLNADKSNDHSYGRGLQADGKTAVEGLDSANNPGTFHGGDIKGLTQKVNEGYFTDLGVNAIWITAPYEQIHGYTSGNKKSNDAKVYPDPDKGGFPYYSYHGYWALDYTNMDANMGTAEDFENFVDSCHERGIRVILDVVMNHVGYTTMQDAVDYGFDATLKDSTENNVSWKNYYYGNSTYLMGGDPESLNFWDAKSSAWSKWWGAGFVKANYPGYTPAGGSDTTMSLCGLPDIQTESGAPEVNTPPILVTKWTKEGRLAAEQKELDDFFSRTGKKKNARNYIIKWLTDWVREYGVDGFRCDTAKHVDKDAWGDLKKEAVEALKEWRTNNPDKPGAKWTDDFWMTGEHWGHGVGKDEYYTTGGFDSMINFSFPKGGAPSSMEATYSNYASTVNSDPDFNILSYISSHDDCLTRDGMINSAIDLLLTPGGAQIFYGDEINRPLGWNDWFTSDYKDQRYRTDMNWDSIDQKILTHWQKLGQFRNNHIAVGAGQHEMLSSSPYTFSRTYHLEEDDEDKVVACLPGKAGTYDVTVGDVFEDGETVTDAYSGEKYEVSGGSVSAACDANGVILLQGSGIVKASVSAKTENKATTYSGDVFKITLKANKAKDTYYSINDGEKVAFQADDVISIGGDTAYEEKTTLKVMGVSEDDGSALEKEFVYQRSKEPTVSDGVFCVKVKKSDFSTAPNIFVYTNDTKETALNGAWPGTAMKEDDDSEYWSFENEDITTGACIILSLGATSNTGGTWRSTPDKVKGLIAQGSMLYDKTSNALSELPSGDPGKVTIKYVDESGKELKSIYRVGVVGKPYTTYATDIEGYTLKEKPDNATGVFAESTEVVYVYTTGSGGTITQKPSTTTTPQTATPGTSATPAVTIKPSTQPTTTVKPSVQPTATVKPGTQTTQPTEVTVTTKPSTPPANTKVPVETAAPTTEPGAAYHSPILFTSTSEYYLGKTIKIEAALLDDIPNCSYSFFVENKSGVKLLQKSYSTDSSFKWKPTSAGTYLIGVTIKDSNENVVCSNQRSIKVVKQPLSLGSLKASTLEKNKVKVIAKPNGGQGSVKYKFSVKAPKGKKVTIKKFSTKNAAQFTASKKGTYVIYLEMKDSSGVRILKTIKYKKS